MQFCNKLEINVMQSPSHTYTHLHAGGEQKNHINAELDNHSKIKVIDGKCPF